MSTPPAICGRAICGRTICGQVDIDEIFEDKSVSFSDHGENPKINLSTGRLMYEQADLSVGGGNYAIEISHIYNSNQAVGLLRCGVGWKLNVYQRLISKDDGTYKYIDGSGGVNTFVLFDSANSRYYNTIDAGQVLTIVDGRASITDGIGNKINFNENGYVVSVVSALNANIKKIFEYDTSGNLVKIYDARLKFSDKIKTYITFEYDHITGLMTSISAYDKYTRLVDRYVYEYDNGYLVEIYHVAINSLGEELTRKCIKRFSYNSEGKLSSIVDTETRSASVFTYAGNRVSKVDFGVINDQAAVGVQLGELAQLGLTDGNGNVMNIGQAVENRSSDAIYLSGGLYVSKGTNQYSYTISDNTQKVCEAVITNENGIKLSYFIDTKNRIISQFEKATDAHRKTLKLESGKILALNNYVTLTSSGEQINGRTTYRANNLTVDMDENFNISHYENYDNKYYECSFWLKHNYDVERLKIKFVYTIANSLTITKYVWINGRACDAWQKVNVLMELPNRNGGGFASDALNKLVITLCDVSGNNKGDFTLSSLLFNPAPKVTFNVSNANGDLPLEYVESIALTCQTTNYMVDQQGSALYMMENDVLKTYMGRYAQPVVINGVTYFDVICNDGTKRLPRVNAMTGYYQNIGFDLTSYNVPVMMQTIMPTDKVRITQRYQFGASSFTLASTNEYDENCFSVTNENGTVTHSTTNNEVYNYKGQKLSSKDEYDITTQYSYDDLGKLIQTKTIGKDGLIGEIFDVHYDENEENVKTASNGYSSTDFTYVSPFAITRETIENSYDATQNVYSNSPNKKVTTHNIYNDRVLKVAQYNGMSKVAENTVTYENGRIRTVSNGYVKYGAKHDFVNDRMEYTRFSGNTETVVQTDTITRSDTGESHTSTFSAGSDTTLKTTLDRYNRISSVSGNNAVSYEYQNGNESTVAQKLTSIVDGYEDRTTVYHYDAYDNLYGWTKGTNHLTVEQITGGDTKYTFGANEKYYTHVNYDANMVMSPRIASTGISRDPDNDSDDDVKEFAEYRKYYEYDGLGRLTGKQVETNEQKQSYEYLKLDKQNTSMPVKTAYSLRKQEWILTTKQDYNIYYNENYNYDKRGNISGINNKVWSYYDSTTYNGYVATGTNHYEQINKTQTKSYTYDDLNRLTKEMDSLFGTRNYVYGNNGKLSSVTKSGTTYALSYDEYDRLKTYGTTTFTYDGYGNVKSKGSTTYGYTRGNFLASVGSNTYSYNAEGIRCKKVVNGVITNYYLDGNKILGEDRRDSSGNVTKLRYFYDIDGLCGIRYNGTNYVVVRNAYGDVVMLLKNQNVVATYYYDAWGNCKVNTYEDDNIGNINPFRWKGHYYDVESGLYYANGSYYDPEVGLHIDASEISSIIDNAFTLFALDRNGIMCDNILAYLPYVYSAFTTRELSVNPLYDPDLNKPWWELAWNTVVSWFASVVRWFNNLDVGWKIGIGLTLFALACIITAITAYFTGPGGTAAVAAALYKVFLDFAIGVVSAFAFTAISMAIAGDFSLETLGGAVADAIFWGGVFAFVSASVNAVKAGIRGIKTANKPCNTPGNCFIAGTLVLCMDENGNECHKPIEDVKVGDMVWAYDEKTGENDWKPVVRLFRNQTNEWYHIFATSEEIICTAEHPFYVVDKGFVPARELKADDKLLLANGKQVAIDKIEIENLAEFENTYNFEVADSHTYYVSEINILTHNICKMDPNNIRYTQDSISPNFRNGNSIDDMINGLKNGNINPNDVPAIRVFEMDGNIYSLDNRRLFAFKEAGMKTINVQWVDPTSPKIAKEIIKKFTTPNNGISIILR